LPSKRLRGVSEGRGRRTYLPRIHVSEEDAFDIMPEALSRQPAAADDKAEDNLRGVIDTTAQKPTDGEPVTGGPSIEEYTPGLADKIAGILGIERKRRSYERTATLALRTGW
jgi:hypothetical protein